MPNTSIAIGIASRLGSRKFKFRKQNSKNLPDEIGDISPKGDGLCCLVGGVDGDMVIGIHLRLLGER